MAGPTAWPQQFTVINSSVQTITANTETVVATLVGVNSRSPGAPIFFDGSCVFAIQAATTSTTLRIRQDSITGSVVGVAQALSSVAAQLTNGGLAVAGQDTPAGEYAGKTYVLTVQATAAGANWNVVMASLFAVS